MIATPNVCITVELTNGKQFHGTIDSRTVSSITLRPLRHAYMVTEKDPALSEVVTFDLTDVKNTLSCNINPSPFDLTGMYLYDRMEAFSLAYVRSLAAVAGCAMSSETPDRRCVDLTLSSKYVGKARRGFDLNLQLKATYNDHASSGIVKIHLSRDCYAELRADDGDDRLLVVVLVDRDLTKWIHLDSRYIGLHFRAYYRNLRGLPQNLADNITVDVPLRRKLTPKVIAAMIRRIGDRGYL